MEVTYLDSAATTNILPEVLDAMMPYLTGVYGNASSHYSMGEMARAAIEDSRELIADMIGCKPQELYFTSGGSESNSWAIKGLRNTFSWKPIHIISSNMEHHSITEALKTRWEQNQDVEYTLVEATRKGFVDVEEIIDSFQLNTRLCSIHAVNNETGIVQPIQEIAFKCKDEGIIMHTDAVQAFGHLQLNVEDLALDLMSASAHKIHGPKGVGFLFISDGIKNQLHPLINGGQQERGIRGSTENVAGIVGFAKAAEIANKNMGGNYDYIKGLSIEFVKMLSEISGVHLNVDLRHTDYRHLSICIDNVRAEELLTLLDSVGICVSSGSACNSDSNKPSHVLKAIGLMDEQANSTIRVSLSEQNTMEELQYFVANLRDFIDILRRRYE